MDILLTFAQILFLLLSTLVFKSNELLRPKTEDLMSETVMKKTKVTHVNVIVQESSQGRLTLELAASATGVEAHNWCGCGNGTCEQYAKCNLKDHQPICCGERCKCVKVDRFELNDYWKSLKRDLACKLLGCEIPPKPSCHEVTPAEFNCWTQYKLEVVEKGAIEVTNVEPQVERNSRKKHKLMGKELHNWCGCGEDACEKRAKCKLREFTPVCCDNRCKCIKLGEHEPKTGCETVCKSNEKGCYDVSAGEFNCWTPYKGNTQTDFVIHGQISTSSNTTTDFGDSSKSSRKSKNSRKSMGSKATKTSKKSNTYRKSKNSTIETSTNITSEDKPTVQFAYFGCGSFISGSSK